MYIPNVQSIIAAGLAVTGSLVKRAFSPLLKPLSPSCRFPLPLSFLPVVLLPLCLSRRPPSIRTVQLIDPPQQTKSLPAL